MNQFIVKLTEGKGPSCLLSVELLCRLPVGEIAVVQLDCQLMRTSKEVVLPGLQSAYDTEEFLVVNLVVALSRVQ